MFDCGCVGGLVGCVFGGLLCVLGCVAVLVSWLYWLVCCYVLVLVVGLVGCAHTRARDWSGPCVVLWLVHIHISPDIQYTPQSKTEETTPTSMASFHRPPFAQASIRELKVTSDGASPHFSSISCKSRWASLARSPYFDVGVVECGRGMLILSSLSDLERCGMGGVIRGDMSVRPVLD